MTYDSVLFSKKLKSLAMNFKKLRTMSLRSRCWVETIRGHPSIMIK